MRAQLSSQDTKIMTRFSLTLEFSLSPSCSSLNVRLYHLIWALHINYNVDALA